MGTDDREAADGRARERCTVLSRAVEEPLAGTAPFAPRWLCLEQRGAWPRDLAAHPDAAVHALAERATAAGWRLLLIRRADRDADGPLRVYLTDTVRCRTTTLTVPGTAALAELPLPTGDDLPGTPVPDPLLLVCTHGRRDRCCALDGRALVTALLEAGEPDVWECTHLGGHRFAPTALVLPTGALHGRLDLSTAVAVRKAAGLGEVEPARCRGRSAWPPAGQVAELAVRAATGLRDADALAVDATGSPQTGTGGEDVVVTGPDARRWAVEVHPDDRAARRPASCGADPEPVSTLRAGPVRRLP